MNQALWEGVAAALWLSGAVLVLFGIVEWASARWIRYRLLRRTAADREHRRMLEAMTQAVWYRQLEEALELAELPVRLPFLLAATAGFVIFAYFSAGSMVRLLQIRYALEADRAIDPSDPLLGVVVALLVGALPLLGVLFRVQRKRQQMAFELIDAVQNLIGTYGPKETVGEWIRKAERTMPPGIRGEWKRLTIAIRSRGASDALYAFARRVDNHWADDLADILLVRAETGHDVTRSLHKLVCDMQTAKSNEQKRRAVISVYRVGTVFMVASAFFVIGFNIHADRNNYRYYFLQPAGREIIVVSFIILFVSMVAVVLSGRKRI